MSKAAGSAGRAGRARASSRSAAKRKRAATGLETAADGSVIGRDPRRLSPVELRELGHRGKPLLQAMRRRCVDCCGGKVDEVRRCTAVACPLWPYRMGTDPWRAEAARREPRRRPAATAPTPLLQVSATPPEPAPEPARSAVRRRRAAKPMSATSGATVPAAAPEPGLEQPLAARGRRRRSAPEATPLLPFLDDASA